MAALIYLLCALASLAAFVLLFRSWRRTGAPLLFWSWLCFAALSANNVLLVVDRLVLPHLDLHPARLAAALLAVMVLLFGLVWEER